MSDVDVLLIIFEKKIISSLSDFLAFSRFKRFIGSGSFEKEMHRYVG